MTSLEAEARSFLEEMQNQPEDIRRIYIYALCQTMVRAGLLEMTGQWQASEEVILIYRKTDTGEYFEIQKPDISIEEEQAMQSHIDFLRENISAI